MRVKKNIPIILTIITVGLVIICIQFILLFYNENNSGMGTVNKEEINSLVQNNDEKIEMNEIDTPYCILKYPKEYFEYLYIEEIVENEVFSQKYYFEASNNKIELFTLYFNNKKIGYAIGSIKVGQDIIPFNIELSDYERDSLITDEEFDMVRNMQEAVNDIIQSFKENENYVEN